MGSKWAYVTTASLNIPSILSVENISATDDLNGAFLCLREAASLLFHFTALQTKISTLF